MKKHRLDLAITFQTDIFLYDVLVPEQKMTADIFSRTRVLPMDGQRIILFY